MSDPEVAEDRVPEVLFVCVHNAGRSQMAAAMAELGLDLSRAFPKPLTDASVKATDVVITMGCGDACPISPGKRYEDWELQDPAGQPIEVVRRIRDDIDGRVRRLLTELVPSAST